MRVPKQMKQVWGSVRLRMLNSFSGGILAGDEGFPFFVNPLVRLIIAASLFVILLSFLAVELFIVRGSGETIILHYNVYFGIDIVGAPWQAFFIPIASTLFFLANLILARRFYAACERIAAHMLLFASFFSALAGGIAVGALSFVNS